MSTPNNPSQGQSALARFRAILENPDQEEARRIPDAWWQAQLIALKLEPTETASEAQRHLLHAVRTGKCVLREPVTTKRADLPTGLSQQNARVVNTKDLAPIPKGQKRKAEQGGVGDCSKGATKQHKTTGPKALDLNQDPRDTSKRLSWKDGSVTRYSYAEFIEDILDEQEISLLDLIPGWSRRPDLDDTAVNPQL
ncbi:MAG: hypothetical protein M4579_002889 [Chaenotheca gracillima]|nr:MAG: hypothetical protein M4579_002889 [Chaenotheca gracillima]